MAKSLVVIMLLAFVAGAVPAQSGVTGFWQTIDDQTGKPRSVVAVYTYEGRLYGRVILIYEVDGVSIKDDIHRKERCSPYLVGDAAYCGLDVIWDLTERGGRWKGGSIMDPGDQEKKPRTYGAEVWREGDDLLVRGKIAFLGRNQVWKSFSPSRFPSGFQVPEAASFRPSVPRTK